MSINISDIRRNLAITAHNSTTESLKINPELSNRAIAKSIGVDPHTVARIRASLDMPSLAERCEASGRRARGRRPSEVQSKQPTSSDNDLDDDDDSFDRLPTGGASVYRCYGARKPPSYRGSLLYIGHSLSTLRRLSNHKTSSWFRDISVILITHYRTVEAARKAEIRAICNERPLYNIIHNNIDPEEQARYQQWLEKQRTKRQRRATQKAQRNQQTTSLRPKASITASLLETQKQIALQRWTEAQARSAKPAIPRPRG